jgi:predicted Zn-dependent protease
MDQRVVEAVRGHPEIHDWTIRFQHGRGAQVYLAGAAVENVRRVGRDAYEIELFNDHEVDGAPMRGSAVIPLGIQDLARLPAILDDGVAMARLVHNPPWSLAGPIAHPEVPLADARILDPGDAVREARQAAEQIRELVASVGAGVRLSAAELFLSAVDEELLNSRGLEATSTSTRVLSELNLLADGDEESEFFHQGEARRLEDLGLPQMVAETAGYARDATRARQARTRLGPVVMTDIATDQLFSASVLGGSSPYLTQASAGAAYARLSRFEIGELVFLGQNQTGDPFTLRSNARRPFSVLSYRFDPDGLPAQDVLIIEDGVLRARTATQRYAQYLGIPATGQPGLAEIAPGPTSIANLLFGEPSVYQVVAFSASNVDAVTGNFGMEIRLGYEIGPDGTRPIKGGSVTGNLFEAMAAARFSTETAQFPSFAGPRAIRFESLQVAGEDA